ncbi:MAG: HypC/HybG/HupF family hydrogenase formation chaperone [Coriobacteriia bacterium]|nr:HypC/HybG/HupF family hydrogenase formation chaperone [Coriobacteriia bacterium]
MCLAVPAKVVDIQESGIARVNVLGLERDVATMLTPQLKVGDYVLVHAGFTLEIVSEEAAQETYDLLKEFPELLGDNNPEITHMA